MAAVFALIAIGVFFALRTGYKHRMRRSTLTGDYVFSSLRDDLTHNGGEATCVAEGYFDAGRGLKAACDFTTGSRLTFAPSSFMISRITANDENLGRILQPLIAAKEKDFENVALALVLLHEIHRKKKSSFWRHIDTLPPEPPKVIALGDDDQLRAMAILVSKIDKRGGLLVDQVSSYVELDPQLFGYPTAPVMRNALAYVFTRSTSYKAKDKSTVLAVAPFQDLLNHHNEPNSVQKCNAQGCTLKALRDISKGEELTVSYGTSDLSDLSLLYKYGFSANSTRSALRVPLDTHLKSRSLNQCYYTKKATSYCWQPKPMKSLIALARGEVTKHLLRKCVVDTTIVLDLTSTPQKWRT